MRYGVRYNPNKKMIEYLDIDEIEPEDILEIIEADDYFDAQKKFKAFLDSCFQNYTFLEKYNSLYDEDIRAAVNNYYRSLGTER
jgi:hypothetical protein